MRSVQFLKSFDRSYSKLPRDQKTRASEAIELLLSSLESRLIPHGLGLKRLQENQWEIRVDLHLRVCFRMEKETIQFGLAGSHDAIKKFLKNL